MQIIGWVIPDIPDNLAIDRNKNSFPISGCIELRSQDMIMEFLESHDSKRGSVVLGALIIPKM